jgi:sulfite reductase alpha subunit-like flavoprotein
MFRQVIEFLKQHASLKKPFSKHYFTNLLKDLSNEDLVALCELLVTKIRKPKRRLYAILGR